MSTQTAEQPSRRTAGRLRAGFIRPAGSGCPVPFVLAATIALITPGRAGDDAKSKAQPHWSFREILSPQVPHSRNGDWVKSPIDAFVMGKLEQSGLKPAPSAGRIAFLRRASFDLVGLPPTPEAIEAFLADDHPGAYERLIDQLLASPQYGERWARHWLDVVRYSDSGGFEADLSYPKAWQFRDFVIRSFNSDKPFDRFIHEQVAGDELWPNDPAAALGSAMYCVGPVLSESAMVEGQIEYEWLTDAADTTGEAFLGLSLGCARCHDHKYDPIRQRDYYAFQAIFAASDRPYPEKVRISRIKALNGLLSDAPVPRQFLDDPRCAIRVDRETSIRLFHREKPLVIHRLHRGELNKPQEVVEPAFPAVLVPKGENISARAFQPGNRRAVLARWMTSRNNPLVARVLANRVWGWHFGQGIVRTPNDFGSQGEEPTHPELLDFLASDLVNHGWSIKRLHRLIMLSSTYQMSSVASDRAKTNDPENLALSHFPRRRLEGEAIRDALLACSGRLDLKPFGKPVVPKLGRDELSGLFDAKEKWPVTQDESEHSRRSVYLLNRRTFVYPLFAAFDPPNVMTSCARRMQTIVPTQALTLLNSPLARVLAAEFANRLIRETGCDPTQNLARAWLLAYGRPISNAELNQAALFLERRTRAGSITATKPSQAESNSGRSPRLRGSANEPGPTDHHEEALAELCLALFNSNEFVFVD
jgi:hypothetical protein